MGILWCEYSVAHSLLGVARHRVQIGVASREPAIAVTPAFRTALLSFLALSWVRNRTAN